MRLARYNPTHELESLERTFNRLFDDLIPVSFKDLNSLPKTPAAELAETDNALHLKLEVPGMEPKDLDIQVTEDSVSISGERKSEIKTEENGNTISEFSYGKFHRVIPLHTRIQNTNVTAEYKDGILNLTLPKTTEEKNKVVKINLGKN
ncbi:MAG: Hsp20/alpha crystallin family protein [Cyanobacteria bacterium J06639_18]